LFSAAVAELVAVSIQDLRPNSQDTTAFYLEKIFQLLADPNVSRSSILATSTKPPPFSPPKHAIWVNSLWFLSLAMSLTCALLATLLQQWARRYLRNTQPPRYSPHKRARIRAFFADGIEKLHMPWAVEALPTLLHTSLFLFFSGLLIFLFNIDHTVFSVVVWWVGLTMGVYGCITVIPIFRQDSPYYAPLSLTAWLIYTCVAYGAFHILRFITPLDCCSSAVRIHFDRLIYDYERQLSRGMLKAAQGSASKLSVEIDGQVLKWTYDALDEDHEPLQFFEGIPGFCSSEVVDMSLGFLIRTCSASSLSDEVRQRRIAVCFQAIDALNYAFLSHGFVEKAFGLGSLNGILGSIQMGHALKSRFRHSDDYTAFCAQTIVAGIIATVPGRDYHWKTLVKDQSGISDVVHQDYLAHGDSVLLANLIHINRQFARLYYKHCLSSMEVIQQTISRFDIRNTLPGLQHDFCIFWNEVACQESINISIWILRPIQHLYISLHQGSDAAWDASTDGYDRSAYPLCNIPGHRPHTTAENTHPPAVPQSTVLPPHPVLNAITPCTVSDGSSFPPPTTDHNRIRLPEESSLHNVPPATQIIPSFDRSSFASVGKHGSPPSLDWTQAATDAPTISPTINPDSGRLPLTVTAPSSAPHQLFAAPSGDPLDPQYLRVFPGSLPSPSLAPVLSDTLPAQPELSLASPAPQIDQVTPGPGLGSSTLVTTISFTAPQGTCRSHPGMAQNDSTFDNSSNSAEPASSVPDIVADLSRHSLDTVPSSRDIDCPSRDEIIE
jgi:Family of unknown function (DUF6535)